MTNEQLKILLESQALLLKEAIEKAVELMPDDAAQEIEKHYIGPSGNLFFMADANPDHWEDRPTGKHLALTPLYDHLETLWRQIDELSEPMQSGAPPAGKLWRNP